jgi:asparagine synthase (glutamine-hydrolysing)
VSRFSRIAVTLSGGLDSACVLALVRHVKPEIRIDSYTIGYGPDDPECVGGRELAQIFRTVHHEVTFDPQHLHEGLPGLVWLMEDCAGREEALLQHLVMGEAARAAPVVFGGYGADALFAGMPRYRLIRMREVWPQLDIPLREVFQFTQTGAYPKSWLGRLGVRLLYRGGSFPPPVVNGASAPARVRDDMSLDAFIAEQFCEAQDSGYLEASLEAGGAEFRDPFQALEVVDVALKVPGYLNVGLWQQKRILRRALSDLLPASIRARRKSLQRVRHDLALSEALDHIADRILGADAIRARALVSPSYVEDLRQRLPHEPYSSERLYRLWTLVCLELWQRQFIDAKARLRDSLVPEAAKAPPTLQPVTAAYSGVRTA